MKQESTKILNYKIDTYEQSGITFLKFRREDGFSVTFTDLGASVYEIIFDNKLMNLVPESLNDFKRKDVYHGKTIGRMANRIKNAEIVVDNITYKLDPNEKGNTLHGGRSALSTKYFDYSIGTSLDCVALEFKYESKHLEAGFPETLLFKVYYFLSTKLDDTYFMVTHFVKTERDTPIRLTNHTYFTLGENNIDNLELSMSINSYLRTDEDLIPIENIHKKGKFEYQGERGVNALYKDDFPLKKRCDIDNYFFIRKMNQKGVQYKCLFLSSKKYLMFLETDYPGVQIYTDSIKDNILYKKTIDKSRRGIAIEPSLPINESCILKANSTYNHTIIYKFFKKK